MELLISPQGLISLIYAEAIPLQSLGVLRITRASHVEPDECGMWWTDLSPSSGPRLGPFLHRSQALQSEHHWLSEHLLLGPDIFRKASDTQHETTTDSEILPISNQPADGPCEAFACGPHLPSQSFGDHL